MVTAVLALAVALCPPQHHGDQRHHAPKHHTQPTKPSRDRLPYSKKERKVIRQVAKEQSARHLLYKDRYSEDHDTDDLDGDDLD